MNETTRKHCRLFLASLGILGCLTAQSAFAQKPAAGDRPNIVYFMIDELGYYELSLMGQWKAHHKGGEQAPWQLYDLSKDVGETTDVAAQTPDVLAQLKAFAAEAHRPMPHGEVYDRALVEKDRNYLGKPTRPKARTTRTPRNKEPKAR